MRRRHHHLHRRYGQYDAAPQIRRKVLGVVVLGIVLLILIKWIFGYFGVGNSITRHGTLLTMQSEGSIQVSIEGGDFKRAENEQKLYPGDRVTSGVASRVLLTFFDDSAVRLNELSDVSIEESYSGEEQSDITFHLQDGTVWITTPEKKIFSGAITRTVTTPRTRVTLPPGTETVITPQSIVVFAAEGIGATVLPQKGVMPLVVGEGQKLALPPEISENEDLYTYRSPLDPTAMQSEFVRESRNVFSGTGTAEPEEGTPEGEASIPAETNNALTVVAPENDALLQTATVQVNGRVGGQISRVRVNGYNAPINESNSTFSLELALPDEDEVEIVITAFDENGGAVNEVRRKVMRDRKPPEIPSITSPAAAGETYRTNSERFLIEGTTSRDTVGIIVNDYRLQLYSPGSTTWSYLASTSINNLTPGKNVYSVVAINKGGYKSEPAVLTILLEPGEEGVVEEEGASATTSTSSTPAVSSVSPDSLPENTPLRPGSLKVIAPTAGTQHSATGTSFLIEGTTVPETDSLWVNDYRLRLYEPGKTTWNYIADTELGTLHRGRNVYRVITRDNRGRILDELQYVVEFRP